MLFILGRSLRSTPAGAKHMLKSMVSRETATEKYKTRNETLLALYGDQPENPPLLQPVSAPLLENDGNGNFRLCHNSFILVIAVVIALLVGFFIWKLM